MTQTNVKSGKIVRVHCCDDCVRRRGHNPKVPADSGTASWLCELCGHYGMGSSMDCVMGSWLTLHIVNTPAQGQHTPGAAPTSGTLTKGLFMTQTAHTPGPWYSEGLEIVSKPALCTVATVEDLSRDVDESQETIANAARIVACVNACEGLGQALMEGLSEIKDGIGGVTYLAAAMAEMRAQNTMLREALEAALDLLTDGDAEAADADRVTAVIRTALGKGGAA